MTPWCSWSGKCGNRSVWHIYWDWAGVEYWPTEFDACSQCTERVLFFLFEEEGGWRRPLHFSLTPAEAET